MGTLKRECCDHFFIFNLQQLRRIVSEFADYYNQHRPHQGIGQRIPTWFINRRPPTSNHVQGKVMAAPILSGLHHSYAYVSLTH